MKQFLNRFLVLVCLSSLSVSANDITDEDRILYMYCDGVDRKGIIDNAKKNNKIDNTTEELCLLVEKNKKLAFVVIEETQKNIEKVENRILDTDKMIQRSRDIIKSNEKTIQAGKSLIEKSKNNIAEVETIFKEAKEKKRTISEKSNLVLENAKEESEKNIEKTKVNIATLNQISKEEQKSIQSLREIRTKDENGIQKYKHPISSLKNEIDRLDKIFHLESK